MGNESVLIEVVSASIGGSISAAALYPLEVLKTKMQAESKSQNQAEAGKTTASSTSTKKQTLSTVTDSTVEDDVEEDEDLVVASVSDTSSDENENVSSAPQQQEKQAPPTDSAIAYTKHLYQTEGIKPFYSGIETSSFQSATEKALYFFAYTGLKNSYTTLTGNTSGSIGTTANLILGCLAEWAHLPITLPLDCWTTKIQTSKDGKAPFAILMTMLSKDGENDGLRGMYKGIQAYTVLCLKPSIQYTVFEQVKSILLIRKRLDNGNGGGNSRTRKGEDESLTAMEAFLLGMVARTIATIAVFPYLRAKVMLQSQQKDDNNDDSTSNKNKTSIPAMLGEMYSNGGVGELFQGIGPELTRGIFSAALMLMVKEKISFAVKKSLMG